MADITIDTEAQLVDEVFRYYNDPLGFVWFAFPWGQKGTILERELGPDEWHIELLETLREELEKQADPEAAIARVIRIAVASGHGSGKTALAAWIVIWFVSTRPYPQIRVTANTEPQLKTVTWRELAKWHKLAINRHWFNWTATSFRFKAESDTWYASAVAWSEANPTAFAGVHEANVLMLMDEASGIADVIWETAEGAQTTAAPGNTIIWLALGNPMSNTGRFRSCWTKFKKRWITFNIDTRKTRKANKEQIQEWIDDYGIDSDFIRSRVLGQFPRTGPKQFIGNELVEDAQVREIDERWIPNSTPKIFGIDVALQGDDETVIRRRWGPKLYPAVARYREADSMKLAGYIAGHIRELKPDIVFIDAIGVGAGVYDRLIQLGFTHVVPCYSGNKRDVLDSHIFYNPRIEWWARMREWLKSADIPANDRDLFEDLIGPEYYYDINMKMRLERKEDMKRRGVSSPDDGDALALTFAQPVPVKMDHENLQPSAEDVEPEVE